MTTPNDVAVGYATAFWMKFTDRLPQLRGSTASWILEVSEFYEEWPAKAKGLSPSKQVDLAWKRADLFIRCFMPEVGQVSMASLAREIQFKLAEHQLSICCASYLVFHLLSSRYDLRESALQTEYLERNYQTFEPESCHIDQLPAIRAKYYAEQCAN